MNKILTFLFVTLAISASAQSVGRLSFDSLYSRSHNTNDTLYVLNFWATWCKPCIEELPDFGRINQEYAGKKFRLLLVNLDFHSKVESQVVPFIQRKQIKSQVIHITDPDPNEWINKVDSSWSGAIPATLICRNGAKLFFKEGAVSYDELNKEILKAFK